MEICPFSRPSRIIPFSALIYILTISTNWTDFWNLSSATDSNRIVAKKWHCCCCSCCCKCSSVTTIIQFVWSLIVGRHLQFIFLTFSQLASTHTHTHTQSTIDLWLESEEKKTGSIPLELPSSDRLQCVQFARVPMRLDNESIILRINNIRTTKCDSIHYFYSKSQIVSYEWLQQLNFGLNLLPNEFVPNENDHGNYSNYWCPTKPTLCGRRVSAALLCPNRSPRVIR